MYYATEKHLGCIKSAYYLFNTRKFSPACGYITAVMIEHEAVQETQSDPDKYCKVPNFRDGRNRGTAMVKLLHKSSVK